MTLHTLRSDDQHQQVFLLLPWYTNQTLDSDERQLVENHVHTCMLCRRELNRLKQLAKAVKQMSDLDVAAEVSFDKLRDKLQALHSNANKKDQLSMDSSIEKNRQIVGIKNRSKPTEISISNRWLGYAIAASLLLVLTPYVMRIETGPLVYHTLSDAQQDFSEGPTLRIVFKHLLPDAEIDSLLAQVHCRRLEGPNSVGAYTIQLAKDEDDASSLAGAIDFLRNQPNVMLVEPVLN